MSYYSKNFKREKGEERIKPVSAGCSLFPCLIFLGFSAPSNSAAEQCLSGRAEAAPSGVDLLRQKERDADHCAEDRGDQAERQKDDLALAGALESVDSQNCYRHV